MKKILVYCFVFHFLNFALSSAKTPEEGLLFLTTESFDRALDDHPVLMVNFHAAWCGHCKNTIPEYFRTANLARLEDDHSHIKFAVIDVTTDPQVAKDQKIEAFPTLRLFLNGKFTADYFGPRKARDIIKFIKFRSEFTVPKMQTIQDFHEYISICHQKIDEESSQESNDHTNTENESHLDAEFSTPSSSPSSSSSYSPLFSESDCRNGLVLGLFPGITHYSPTNQPKEQQQQQQDSQSIDSLGPSESLADTDGSVTADRHTRDEKVNLERVVSTERLLHTFLTLSVDSMISTQTGFSFAYSTSVPVAEYFGLSADMNGLVILKRSKGSQNKRDISVVSVDPTVTADTIQQLLQFNSLPDIIVFSDLTTDLLSTFTNKPQLLLFYDDMKEPVLHKGSLIPIAFSRSLDQSDLLEEAHNPFIQKLWQTAKKFKTKVIFVLVPLSTAAYVWTFFRIDPAIAPYAMMVDMADHGDLKRYELQLKYDYERSEPTPEPSRDSSKEPVCEDGQCSQQVAGMESSSFFNSGGDGDVDGDDAAAGEIREEQRTNEELESLRATTNIDMKQIEEFVEGYFSNTLSRYILSEDASKEDLDAPATDRVVRVVGTSFRTIVMNSGPGVLLAYLAPWCGYCKSFEATLEELATIYIPKSPTLKDRVIIAKIDATKNEIEYFGKGVEVQSFPTIAFFPAGDKVNPIVYKGERNADSIISFLEENRRARQQSYAGEAPQDGSEGSFERGDHRKEAEDTVIIPS